MGAYRMQVKASGFRLYTVEQLTTEVARTLVQDVQLELGDISQELTVTSRAAPIDRVTTSVGHVIDSRTVQDAPLNGRTSWISRSWLPGRLQHHRADSRLRPAAV